MEEEEDLGTVLGYGEVSHSYSRLQEVQKIQKVGVEVTILAADEDAVSDLAAFSKVLLDSWNCQMLGKVCYSDP